MIPNLRPDAKRYRERGHREDGWYLAPDPQTGRERRWMRATTFAHITSDEAAIERWRRRKVAEGLAYSVLRDHRFSSGNSLPDDIDFAACDDVLSLVDAIAEAGEDWRKAKKAKLALDDVCERLAESVGTAAGSSAGTDIHALTEWHDAGRINEIEVPVEYLADLAAYVEATQDAGLAFRPQWIERIIVNSQVETCGTTDRILTMPDGRVLIGDLKTQQSISFGWQEIAMQLAQYANGDGMLTDDGRLEPMPANLDRSRGLVIWLPVGQARVEFHELDLEAGWDDCLFARELLRRRARSKALGRRWVPPGKEVAQLTYLIREAQSQAALRALIEDAAKRGHDTREVRELANRRWEVLAA